MGKPPGGLFVCWSELSVIYGESIWGDTFHVHFKVSPHFLRLYDKGNKS